MCTHKIKVNPPVFVYNETYLSLKLLYQVLIARDYLSGASGPSCSSLAFVVVSLHLSLRPERRLPPLCRSRDPQWSRELHVSGVPTSRVVGGSRQLAILQT